MALVRALGAVLLVLLLATACQDDASRLEEHFTRGEEYLAAEQWPEAVLEYKNMLKLDPNDARAHWGLARAMLGGEDLRKAYWELQETIRLDPKNLEARLRYGQFLLFGKDEDRERAIALADEVLAAREGDADALVLRGRALMALKRNDEARAALEAAVAAAPDQPKPLLLLADFERREGNLEAAETLFQRLTEVEQSFLSNAALAGFLASLGGERDEDAEAAYRRGLELATETERANAYSLLANFYAARERDEEVEAVLREGIDSVEDNLRLIYGLARFYHTRGERERADAMILEAAESRPGDPEPLLLLSQYRAHNDDLPGALEAAERAIEAAPDDVRAKLRKAEVLVDMGYRAKNSAQVAQGRAVVDAVLGVDEASPEALFVKAKIDIAEGDLDAALSSLRRVVDSRPDWAQAHFLLGSALFLNGDRAESRTEVGRAMELDANFLPAERLMARVHAALGDHDLAVDTGRSALRKDPSDHETRVLVAQSLVRLRRVDEALAELEKIPTADRGAEEEFALGRVYTLKGNAEAAREHLMLAAEQRPGHQGILSALLDLDMREGRLEESAARVGAALEASPDDPELLQLNGQILLYLGKAGEAEDAFRRAIDLDPNDLRAYQNLARYLAVVGRPSEVVSTYEKALRANPKSANLHLIVGSLYELQQRPEEAMKRYEEAIQLDPNLAVAKNNLAYLLAERGGNLDRALDLAQEAKSLLSDSPNAADTLGWVLYKKEVPSAAIGYLREAEGGMSPDDPQIGIVRHHLALAYEANGEPDRAISTLERAIADIETQVDAADPPQEEPDWAQELRTMLARLNAAS